VAELKGRLEKEQQKELISVAMKELEEIESGSIAE
jgi:hypothetical protein